VLFHGGVDPLSGRCRGRQSLPATPRRRQILEVVLLSCSGHHVDLFRPDGPQSPECRVADDLGVESSRSPWIPLPTREAPGYPDRAGGSSPGKGAPVPLIRDKGRQDVHQARSADDLVPRAARTLCRPPRGIVHHARPLLRRHLATFSATDASLASISAMSARPFSLSPVRSATLSIFLSIAATESPFAMTYRGMPASGAASPRPHRSSRRQTAGPEQGR